MNRRGFLKKLTMLATGAVAAKLLPTAAPPALDTGYFVRDFTWKTYEDLVTREASIRYRGVIVAADELRLGPGGIDVVRAAIKAFVPIPQGFARRMQSYQVTGDRKKLLFEIEDRRSCRDLDDPAVFAALSRR